MSGFFFFIWINMLWVYDRYKLFNSFSAETVFKRQNLTETVREKRNSNYFVTYWKVNSYNGQQKKRERLSDDHDCAGLGWLDVSQTMLL